MAQVKGRPHRVIHGLVAIALIDFQFAAKSLLEALAQQSEQFFRRLEFQPLASILFFHQPFRLRAESLLVVRSFMIATPS